LPEIVQSNVRAWSAKSAEPLDSVAVRRGELNSKQIQFDAGETFVP
jgi:hypothetical protein